MAEDVDQEELAVLETISDLRERAIGAFLADKPVEALALAEDAILTSAQLKLPEAVPPLLKNHFASLLYRIGQVLAQAHRLEEAKRALMLVSEIEGRLGNLAAQASLINDLATVLLNAGRPEEAVLLYKEKVLPLRLGQGDETAVRRTQRSIGLAYLRLKDADACYSYLLLSLEATREPLTIEEVTFGLRTVLACQQYGLEVPASFLDSFCSIARSAGAIEIEQELAALKPTNARQLFRRIKVFLSYAHTDREIVLQTYRFLRSAAGVFDVFLDQQRLYPGWAWESSLITHLREADVLVLFLGHNTLERPYVQKEFETFLEAKQEKYTRKVIPVFLPTCNEIPPEVSDYQGVDLRQEDMGRQLRRLGQAIHDVMFLPMSEISLRPERQLGEQPVSPNKTEGRPSLEEKWAAGEVGIDPRALRQMINLGILRHDFHCAYSEHDLTSDRPRSCSVAAVVICCNCGLGACDHAFHLYDRFCTIIPPSSPVTLGTKLFYWCPQCNGPVCTRCLEIEDDYPCPPVDVLSYRFYCPSCRKVISVVPVLNVDYEGVSDQLKEWAHAGGPPNSGRLA
jgi:tetratricopeptide (TPR) repeat protein